MGRTFQRRSFPTVAAGALLVLSILASGPGAFGGAIEDRLVRGSLKRVSVKEVVDLVEKHPDDAELHFAAGTFLVWRERRQSLFDRAVELDKSFEAPALLRMLDMLLVTEATIQFRGGAKPRVMTVAGRKPVSDVISESLEILNRVVEIDPDNGLPHLYLATFAFMRDDEQEGFAHIDQVLQKPRFDTYDVRSLKARFRLLDQLDGHVFQRDVWRARLHLLYMEHAQFLARKLIEQGKQRLAAGDRAGALAVYASADRLADKLLLARPRFVVAEGWVARIKGMVLDVRGTLEKAEDEAAAAGLRLQVLALMSASVSWLESVRNSPTQVVVEVQGRGEKAWPSWSQETLQARLAESQGLGQALDTAAAQVQHYFGLPEFQEMMALYLDALVERGELAACVRVRLFFEESSLPREQEQLLAALDALHEAFGGFPESQDRACASNLKQIGLALFMYTLDHDGASPDALEDLARYLGKGVPKCPVTSSEYQYLVKGVGLKTVVRPELTIVAYDATAAHRGGRHALFFDAHVEWLPEEAFQDRLRRQQAGQPPMAARREPQPAPSVIERQTANNARAAAGILRSLAACQATFKARRIVDQDGDRVGEYGWLQELSGAIAPRTRVAALAPGEVYSAFMGKVDAHGVVAKRGYCFVVYLPTASGPAAGESAGSVPPADPANADIQEKRWIAYAWPEKFGLTGREAFVITQQAEVYVCENADGRYRGPENAPEPGAALISKGGREQNLQSGLPGPGQTGSDDQKWAPVQ